MGKGEKIAFSKNMNFVFADTHFCKTIIQTNTNQENNPINGLYYTVTEKRLTFPKRFLGIDTKIYFQYY